MDVPATLLTQRAFSVLGALVLTAYLFPPQASVTDKEEFDYIVVGAGSAGSVVAHRLSEAGAHRVLLIDAGADPPLEALLPALFPYLPQTKNDWNFTSENDHYSAQAHKIKALNLTCGRVLGGGSSVNYMLYVRGCPGDYDAWARAAADDTWAYRNVLPYFIKSERLQDIDTLASPSGVYHGTGGFLGVTRENRPETYKYLNAFREAGHDVVFDVNSGYGIGYTLPLYTIAGGTRQTTAFALSAHRGKNNLHVLKNALVSEILFDDDNNAIGVKAITADKGAITLRARREVIVSAGALNTPKLLMLSGVGPREHLQEMGVPVRSDLPVGMNLQDHAVVMLSIKMERSNAPPAPPNPHRMPSPIVVGYATLNESRSCAEYQVFNFIVPNDSDAPYQLCAFNFGIEESICGRLREAGRGRNTLYANLNILHPRSRGRVTLRSRDPHDAPVVRLGTFSDERDLDDIAEQLLDYLRVLNTTYFRSAGAELADLGVERCRDSAPPSRDYWRCYARETVSSMFHYAGTSALGAVLDARLRVRGVRRLRVADNSAMPTLPSGNTNAPAVMIGEKAAHFILQEHAPDHPYVGADLYNYFFNFFNNRT